MNLSIEVLPNQVAEFLSAYHKLSLDFSKSELRVFIPHVNGVAYSNVIKAHTKISKEGFKVTPHLAVRNLKISDEIDKIKAFSENEVESLLIIGGDNSSPELFSGVYEFMTNQWESNVPVKNINFATFPEGHPHLEVEQGKKNLLKKIQWSTSRKLKVNVYSQICFDSKSVIKQSSEFSAVAGMNYNISFIAPCKVTKLLKIIAITGMRNSISFMQKHNVFKMLGSYNSDTFIEDISNSKEKFAGLHCYSFGNYKGALEKLNTYRKLFD